MANEIAVKEPTAELSVQEKFAYDYFVKNRGKTLGTMPLSPSTQAQLFELFLNGVPFNEIRRMNPSYSLGQIIAAAVDNNWFAQRESHMSTLLNTVKDRVGQISLESVDFLSNLLSAAHKKHGDSLKRYLQTGNESELSGIALESLRSYREALELLMRLTGQDIKRVKGTVEHEHRHELTGAADLLSGLSDPDKAARMLEILEPDDK